jgi:hypothetical protein
LFDFFWVQTVMPAVHTGQRQKQLLIKRLFEGDAFSLLTAHADALMSDLSFSWLTATVIAFET